MPKIRGFFREDLVCHDYKAGLIQIVYGDPYGRPVLSNPTGSDANSPNHFRFCHIDHQHPENPTLITRDMNGKNFLTEIIDLV